jgi:hypothetical protein
MTNSCLLLDDAARIFAAAAASLEKTAAAIAALAANPVAEETAAALAATNANVAAALAAIPAAAPAPALGPIMPPGVPFGVWSVCVRAGRGDVDALAQLVEVERFLARPAPAAPLVAPGHHHQPSGHHRRRRHHPWLCQANSRLLCPRPRPPVRVGASVPLSGPRPL